MRHERRRGRQQGARARQQHVAAVQVGQRRGSVRVKSRVRARTAAAANSTAARTRIGHQGVD